MDCSCEALKKCTEERILENQGSDELTIFLVLFILIMTYLQSICIDPFREQNY